MQIKKLLPLFLSGFVGASAFYVLTIWMPVKNTHQISEVQKPSATLVNNQTAVSATPFDFIDASEKATQVVVHIHAEESYELARERFNERKRNRRSPFDDFFGNNPFGDFFGSDFFGHNFYPKTGSGSGVIISSDGYIVTNNHVVSFADNIKVTLPDGREVVAERIGTDPSSDLAVIKINLDEKLAVLDYGNSDNLRIGEWVLAVGNPFSYLTSTVTAGIVSAKGRDLDLINGGSDDNRSIEEFIQTDAAVNPGNSGGALVNTKGELVGINTAIATPTGVYAGYSFAIPSNLVKRIVSDIIEYGDIERVQLGITGYDVDDDLKQEFNLNVDEGFYVVEIDRGSAAQYSGILPGDVIIEVDGEDIKNFDDITETMKYNKVGDQVRIKVLRNGEKKQINVKFIKKY